MKRIHRKRHLEYYLDLAERLEPKLRGRGQIETLNLLEEELDNLRLALAWGLQTDVQSELRLASVLKLFWHIRFHWAEAIDWLEKGVEIEKQHLQGKPDHSYDRRFFAKALSVLGFHLSMPDLGLENWRHARSMRRLHEKQPPGRGCSSPGGCTNS